MNRPVVLTWTVAVVCAATLILLHASNGLNSDEGVVLNGAWNILNGRRPYTDFFEYIPPGAFYFFAVPWQIIGPGFWTAKVVAIAVIGAGAGITYACARLTSQERMDKHSKWLLVTPFAFCLVSASWPAINHNTLNVVLLLGSTYFCLRSLCHRSSIEALWAGGLTGLATVVLLHRSAALGAAFSAMLLWLAIARGRTDAWQSLATFTAGAVAPPLALLLAWDGQLLFDSLILFPMTRYATVNKVNPIFMGFLAAALLAACWLLRPHLDERTGFLLLLQGALAATAMQRPDLAHITWCVFPLIVLAPLITRRFTSAVRSHSLRERLRAYCWLVPVLVFLLPNVVLLVSRGGLFEDRPASFQALRYVREHCAAEPFVYAGPFSPGLYFETRKLNPTRYSILLTDFNTGQQFDEARTALEAANPGCILTAYSMAEKFGHRKDNPVDAYISSHYQRVLQEGSLVVWRRG